MPVYLKDLSAATCVTTGCLCYDRVRPYPSDLTDGYVVCSGIAWRALPVDFPP